MNREDLFQAIGGIEESCLERSEGMKARRTGRIALKAVLVAVLATALAGTVLAAAGFIHSENPGAVLEAFFGDKGNPHSDGRVYANSGGGIVVEPAFDREELDATLAEELVAPFVCAGGQTLTRGGDTLTVESYLFDSVTGCGILYYSLENPKGISGYAIQSNGELWWPDGEKIDINYAHQSYLLAEQTTDTKLFAACYYIFDAEGGNNLDLGFYGQRERIHLPLEDGGGMKGITLAGGGIKLSPIGLWINGVALGIADEANDIEIDRIVIQYSDGKEYLVKDSAAFTEQGWENYRVTVNFAYAWQDWQAGTVTYALDRIVAVDQVEAVVLDGVKYSLDE